MSATAEVPTFVEPSARLLPRLQLRSVVPDDEFLVIRLALMFEFLFVYLWWLRVRGLPIDRISVAISVAPVCAFVGKIWRRASCCSTAFYCVMGWPTNALVAQLTRRRLRTVPDPQAVAGGIVRNIDRALLSATTPTLSSEPLLVEDDPLGRRRCLQYVHDALRGADHCDGRCGQSATGNGCGS